MEATADFIARHALLVLLCVTAALLALTATLWRMTERFGPATWTVAVRAWDALATHAFTRRIRRIPGMERILGHTLTAGRYLGLYALGSFALALAALAAFFEIADEIGINEDMARFDLALSHALAQHLSLSLIQAMAWITALGNKEFLIPLGVVVTVVLIARRQRLLAVAWAVATSSGALLNNLLKSLFERTRPMHDHGVLVADGWSFPSGHAAGSLLVYGLLAYLIVRLTPRMWHLPATIVCMLLIVFVGSSRVFLQVHYLSDVFAGYASATAWGALCLAGLEAVRQREWDREKSPAALSDRAAPRRP